jgi:periplasmic protein TonB
MDRRSLLLYTFLTLITSHAFPQSNQEDSITQSNDSVKWVRVEKQPEYPGGFGEMMKFIKKELKYPPKAKKSRIEGDVLVSFVVTREGSLSDVKTIRSLHPDCDAEAERIVKAMPSWVPGTVKNKPVFVRFNIPIRFRIN